jgi:flagellar biosynthetic protein FlhB
MAEDSDSRTEAATPARLSRARDEGHAPVSHELASFANLGAALLVILAFAPELSRETARQLAMLLGHAGSIDSMAAILATLRQAAGIAAQAFLPLALAVALLGAGVVLAQTRLALRLTALTPDFSRINPMTGVGRLFGANHGIDALKSILKIIVLSVALWFALSAQVKFLPGSLRETLGAVASVLKTGIIAIAAALIVVQAFIAVLDVAWSRASFGRSVKMSREDVKQETKDSDGNPQIKAKIRAIRNARARQNLKKAMARATVVVTNPTHYAVALAYARNSAAPPKIIAKGMGEIAARIRELAAENRTPIVPNPPLARALHALDLESEIPIEHYKAVADIIAYIWKLEAQATKAKMI